MLKCSFVFFVFLFATSALYAQYLDFNDIETLIYAAEERIEAEKLLIAHGFSFLSSEYILEEDDEEDDTTHYQIIYHKKLIDDECFMYVWGDTDEDIYTVGERSYNEDRSFYFASILAEAELEPIDSWDNGDGDAGFSFETKRYSIIISTFIDEDGLTIYKFSITR